MTTSRGIVSLPRAALLLCVAALLPGCSREQAPPTPVQGTLIGTAHAVARDVPVVATSIGRLESRAAPHVAAEIDARVLRLAVDEGDTVRAGDTLAELDATPYALELEAAGAELARVDTLRANEERRVKRFEELAARGSISREQLDDARAQLAMLHAQRDAVAARARIAEDQHARAVVRAPLAGRIERRLVSAGDFARRGTPLFAIATSNALRALLPVPEPLAREITPGLAVELDSPLSPGRRLAGRVTELRPAVGEANRAVWVIVDVDDAGDWRPEATVRARIVLRTRADAVVVPAPSVVRRPAGDVVYAIVDGRAAQRVVSTGERIDGLVEIREGLVAGATVAVEGAGYLSDGAPVRLAESAP